MRKLETILCGGLVLIVSACSQGGAGPTPSSAGMTSASVPQLDQTTGPPTAAGLRWGALERAEPGDGNSPFKAWLYDATMIPPSDDVPPGLRGLSGRWQGWMGRGKSGSVAVAITNVTATNASGSYAYAGMSNVNGQLPINRQFSLDCKVLEEATLDCNLLRPGLIGLTVYLKLRRDGHAMIQYTGDGRSFTRGLMSRS